MDAKICGIKDAKTLNYIINHNNPPRFIGFITNYPKSKRYIDYENLKKLINLDKKKTNFVSVLVNPNDEILEKIKDLNFDYYQLYDVNPEKTKIIKEKYKVKIITALTIENKNDIEKYKKYQSISEIILFDSKGYENSAKLVPFAGYLMPMNYKDGIIKEHLHVRNSVGLFDVSHMGQILIPNTKFNKDALMKYIPLNINKLLLNK